jgi:predicted transcriptional regulator
LTPKRSRLEIYLDVLKVVRKGTHKPTRIMYRTNLSWKPLMKVFESMIEQDLIARDEEGVHATYRITEKGRNILEYFDQAMDLLEVR